MVNQNALQAVLNGIKLLDDIAKKTKKVLVSTENELYAKLRETYVLYHAWMSSKNKAEYFEELQSYLDLNNISYNASTSEALMMTKAILGEENKTKASKYGKHMDTAYRKGITAKEYPAWMEDNGVEIVSRRRSLIKHAKKAKIDEQSLLQNASALIYKWLGIREAMPIATATVKQANLNSYKTLEDEKFKNAHYEIAICKRRRNKDNTESIDTLWLLPNTESIEKIYMHQLTYAIHKNLPQLEAQMESEELQVLGTEIDQLMLEDEIYQFALQDDALILQSKIQEAHLNGRDSGDVYASHKFVKPKIKKIIKTVSPTTKIIKKTKSPNVLKNSNALLPKGIKAHAKVK